MSARFNLSRVEKLAAFWCQVMANERANRENPWRLKINSGDPITKKPAMTLALGAFNFVHLRIRAGNPDLHWVESWAEAESLIRAGYFRNDGQRRRFMGTRYK